MTKVFDMRKSQYVAEYTSPPREAVISYYAQSHADYNTWNYERYAHLLEENRYSIAIGDYCALKTKGE